MATHALNQDIVLVGFMAAGKSTIGAEVARRLGRDFVDTDLKLDVELLATDEAAFRQGEFEAVAHELRAGKPGVYALGGGAVETPAVRALLREAFVVVLDIDLETAWKRARGTERPLARNEEEFRRRYEQRQPLYAEVADARASDADGVILAAAGVHVEVGAL